MKPAKDFDDVWNPTYSGEIPKHLVMTIPHSYCFTDRAGDVIKRRVCDRNARLAGFSILKHLYKLLGPRVVRKLRVHVIRPDRFRALCDPNRYRGLKYGSFARKLNRLKNLDNVLLLDIHSFPRMHTLKYGTLGIFTLRRKPTSFARFLASRIPKSRVVCGTSTQGIINKGASWNWRGNVLLEFPETPNAKRIDVLAAGVAKSVKDFYFA